MGGSSSYEGALLAAGAEVHAFGAFGDYQGSWLAYVTYRGQTGWVRGYYGSCSECDSFEAELGWGFNDFGDETEEEYNTRVADFGRSYLDGQLWTTQQLVDEYQERAEWDSDAEDVITFVKGFQQ